MVGLCSLEYDLGDAAAALLQAHDGGRVMNAVRDGERLAVSARDVHVIHENLPRDVSSCPRELAGLRDVLAKGYRR